MRPAIGIPLSLDDRGRWRPGRDYAYTDAAYAAAVVEAGGLALALPIQPGAAALAERLDGLLLPGGDDFPPPAPYPSGVRFDPVPAAQLAFDRALLDTALRRDLPVLGICYGMQLLALAHGGTLVFDLPTDRPAGGEHRLPPGATHAIDVEAGSRLAGALGAGRHAVGSRHHQAVATPGAGMRIAARAEDGLIEAIEREGAGFGVGVQWHPEAMDPAHRLAVFGAFVAACAARARG